MTTATETKKKTPAKTARVKKEMEETQVAPATVVMAGTGQIFTALGRRKTSIARVRMTTGGGGKITINGRTLEAYFPSYELKTVVLAPLGVVGLEGALDIEAIASGGGLRGQAESVRLGLCRALVAFNETYRKTLKKLGYLTRDPRAKERKKFGLRKARRSPQWSKR